ncbi:MAG TPA: DUF711 family protein [Anaerolineales bacterium]|nr:DUF711 family protein [Anaerolineales bacterium]
MKIRSITYFCNPGWPLDEGTLQQAGAFLELARPAFEAAGYEVQTARLATPPFPLLLDLHEGQAASQAQAGALQLVQEYEVAARLLGYDYISLGPALPEIPSSYPLIPPLLAASQSAFFSGLMTTQAGGVSLPAVRACAEIIHQAAAITPDGFSNLRFAALANVPPGSPFFPAAYHRGAQPVYALATEAADLAVEAFSQSVSLEEARQLMIDLIQAHARTLGQVAQKLRGAEVSFGGIDFSLAPYPEQALSLGTAFEQLGVPQVGLPGSLAAAAIIADSLDQAQFPRAGFSGLFLPVLEDATLARRASQGSLGLKDLLLYSAVCGTGLDTVPLPGDITPGALGAILLDLAALAQRLDKPLTARLMPIPGKAAGDATDFDFPYFANSRVLPVSAQALGRHLGSQAVFTLQSRTGRGSP